MRIRQLVILALVALFVIGIIVLRFFGSGSSSPTKKPGSGTSSTTSQSQGSTETTFLGTNLLTDKGVTKYQVNGYQEAVRRYSEKTDQAISRAKILPDTVKSSYDHDSGISTVTFKLQLDDTKVTARLKCFDITSIQLLLINSDGDTIFSSGTVDARST